MTGLDVPGRLAPEVESTRVFNLKRVIRGEGSVPTASSLSLTKRM